VAIVSALCASWARFWTYYALSASVAQFPGPCRRGSLSRHAANVRDSHSRAWPIETVGTLPYARAPATEVAGLST